MDSMFKDGLYSRCSFSLALVIILGGGLVTTSVSARAHDPFAVVLVDKSKNQIALASYLGDRIEIKKRFHATLGKALGDKELENDLKTPEGIYFFTSKHTPPSLRKKFGNMALNTNYPNPIDRMAGKTGYAIMLHSTDDPPRLKRNLDSEGCVVIDNPEIEEIAKEIRLGLTPMIIYPELKPEYLQVDSRPEVRQAFDRWLGAWNGKDLENYIGSYSAEFQYNGMGLKNYRDYKKSLNEKYAKIDVKAEHLRFYLHPKYDVVSFTQVYESKLKNGSKGFKSSGTKYLYFVKREGALQIVNESYSSVKED